MEKIVVKRDPEELVDDYGDIWMNYVKPIQTSADQEMPSASGMAIKQEIKEESDDDKKYILTLPQRYLDLPAHCFGSKINDSDEEATNYDDQRKDFSCNIKEERDSDFSEDDKNSSHNGDNEEKYEDEAMFETKIEVEYNGVQYDEPGTDSEVVNKEILGKMVFPEARKDTQSDAINSLELLSASETDKPEEHDKNPVGTFKNYKIQQIQANDGEKYDVAIQDKITAVRERIDARKQLLAKNSKSTILSNKENNLKRKKDSELPKNKRKPELVTPENLDVQDKIKEMEETNSRLQIEVDLLKETLKQQNEKDANYREIINKMEHQLAKRDQLINDLNQENENSLKKITQLQEKQSSSSRQENFSVSSFVIRKNTKDSVGFVDENDYIYLGNFRWLPNRIYEMASHGFPTPSVFVYNMSVAVFGIKGLMTSTVSGKRSNARKNKEDDEHEFKKFDPDDILAIKSIFQYFLENNFVLTAAEIDNFVEKTKNYITRKGSSIKIDSRKPKRTLEPKKTVPKAQKQGEKDAIIAEIDINNCTQKEINDFSAQVTLLCDEDPSLVTIVK
ncbi:unnamed protein product [Brassicogethes aeneus]|uniref:BEN domain-containing protein n=1 Tax=Brassicogethes aeneus TaxID=1431903 RepID=A0A9P0AXS3_BRAAE|nr:unnamed protein product [Brassicogethes aeneus]